MKKFQLITEYSEVELRQLIEESVLKILPQIIELQGVTHKPQSETYLTRKEVRETLKISYPTIAKLTNSGKLKSTIIGGSYRYKKSDVISLFKG